MASLATYFSRRTAALPVMALFALTAWAQQTEDYGINITSSQNVDIAGNSQVRWIMNFNPPRGYDRVKRSYPNLYVLFRDVGSARSNLEINKDSLKITSDDGQRSINFAADVWGLAMSRNNRWRIELSANEQVSTQDGNRVFTVLQFGTGNGLKISIINTYVLPQSATNVQVDKENHLLTYVLPPVKSSSAEEPTVDVSVRYRKRLMAALYKIYGDPDAQSGTNWTAKTILKNAGKAPIYNLKVYYRLGEYSEMSVPDAYSVVPAGGIVVDRYYPVIQSRVAQLRTQTPVQLYIRYEYKDAAGKSYSNEMTRRLEMLGVNQFEFSNLNDEDRTGSWLDDFNNAPLLSAFVTRMDEAVKQFAGYISEAAGGVAAAASDDDAKRWLKAAYDLERANHIVYQTPSGFMTEDHSSGQDIKFPRDVFRDKSGTCVDLAITYAALAEAVGLEANVMLVPGHAFAVVKLPRSGALFPVENTGLAGGDNGAPFEKVAQYGQEEFQKYVNDGLFYFVNVREQWTASHVPNPELQPLGVDFLSQSGIQRANALSASNASSAPGPGRKKATGAPGTSTAGQRVGAAAQAEPEGKQFLVVHRHGMNGMNMFCVGTLTVTADEVKFEPTRATDGRLGDGFALKRIAIKEAARNRIPINENNVLIPSFHIKLTTGTNYDFAVITPTGQGLAPDEALLALISAGGQ